MLKVKTFVDSWADEYKKKGIPSSIREEPSGSVAAFVCKLPRKFSRNGSALDIGCGTGRNSLYLAEQGFDVSSIDFLPDVVQRLRIQSQSRGLSSYIHTYCANVTEVWPFDNDAFDIAIDTFCYKHQVTDEGKRIYRQELARVLRKGGFYLLTLAGVDDGYYGPLLADSPDRREHVIVDPVNKIASILYSREDIEKEFSDSFQLIDYAHKEFSGMMHGGTYRRSTHVFIFIRGLADT